MPITQTPDSAPHPFTARIPEKVFQALKAYGEATNQSMNAVVTDALQSYLGATERRAEVERRVQEITSRHSVALEKLRDL